MKWTVELYVRRVEETELLGPHVPPVELLYHHLVPTHGGHMKGGLSHLIPDGKVMILVKVNEPFCEVLQFASLCRQVKRNIALLKHYFILLKLYCFDLYLLCQGF